MAKPDDQINYDDVMEAAAVLLRAAAMCTINEQKAMDPNHNGKISSNEALGMAVRATTERAMVLQAHADHEEQHNAA